MKIVIVSELLSGLGGTEAVVNKTITLLHNHYAIETLLYLYGNRPTADLAWLADNQYQLSSCKFRNPKLQQCIAAWGLMRLIRRHKPQAILAITPIACGVARLALIFSGRKAIPLIAWPHIRLGYKIRKHVNADGCFAISRYIMQQCRQLGFSEQQLALIYNPISPAKFAIDRPTATTTFIYVGRITWQAQKRVVDLLSACTRLSGDWHLHIIGGGEDEAKCQQFCYDHQLTDRVHWHGWRASPWQYIKDTLKQVSALILTSDYEGFGLVLAEALAHGVFVVSADCICGPADIIHSGDNGLLYPPRAVETLTDNLQQIIDGLPLPAPTHLQQSVTHFYDENYIHRFHHGLISAIRRKQHIH